MVTRVVSLDSIESPGVPALPLAPVAYDQRYQDTTNNILRQYYTTLQNVFQSLLSEVGGRFIRSPYGIFSDYTDQTAAAINTSYVMTFNTTDYTNGIALGASTSKITVTNAGIYSLRWSGQFESSDAALQTALVWVKVNGTGITGTTRRVSVPIGGRAVIGPEYTLSLNGGDYVELWWQASATTVSIQTTAGAGVAPNDYPSLASVKATMTFVSALPTV
jgi:hypothetical protein